MDRGIALGCTSGDYNAQDKLFSVTFAGSADLPQISIVPDIFDAPYGLVKNPDRTGHMKPTHLPLHAACVEQGGAALLTLDLDPSAVPADAKGFATNLILPATAGIRVEGKPRKLSAPGQISISDGATITVGGDDGVVALRLIHVDGLPEARPAVTLAADSEGLAHHAIRLKIAHMEAGRRTAAKHLRIALLAVAREGPGEQDLLRDVHAAQVSSEVHGREWTVKAVLPGLSLELARSTDDRKAIASQLVKGAPAPAAVLSVNGRDLAGSLLEVH
jgi:hypothetical protein